MTSEYLHWFKSRQPAPINLALSGLADYPLADLGGRIDDTELNGRSLDGYEPLLDAIAEKCAVPAECVVTTYGTSMANYLVMAALLERGDEVLIERPAYEPLVATARHLGAEVKRFPRPGAAGFRPIVDVEAVTDRTKLIVLTNLHNPTCVLTDESALRGIGDAARRIGARVLVDEVYLECRYERACSAFHLGGEFITTGSLTKAYGLGGLRCGWILADPELARRIWRIKDLIDPGSPHPLERLSVLALQRLDRIANRAKTIVSTNRELLRTFLDSCPHLEVVRTEFGTCVAPGLRDATRIDRLLTVLREQYETDVVPGKFFEMPEHFRIGIGGDSETLGRGLERLGDALKAVME